MLRFLLLVAACLAVGHARAQEVVFVNHAASGSNDGTSWSNAFNDLQGALAAAAPGAQIWVAEGTYAPTQSGDRGATFLLRDSIALLGGFVGSETSPDERDWEDNPTVLTGEIGSTTSWTDNSFHVVTGTGTGPDAVLDGFIITRGYAIDSPLFWGGGGIINMPGSPTIRNCVFEDNEGNSGGAFLARLGSQPRIENTQFHGNRATSGGALYIASGSRPVCIACEFGSNVAEHYGGAVSTYQSMPLFIGSVFASNTSLYGGAVYAFDPVAPVDGFGPVFIGCRVENNSAFAAGGIYIIDMWTTVLSTVFAFNVASGTGSGVIGGGGIILSNARTSVIANSVFVGNRGARGSAVTVGVNEPPFPTEPHLINSTFAGNRSLAGGGAISTYRDPTVTVRNSIVWGNHDFAGVPSEIVVGPDAVVDVGHGIVRGGFPGPLVLDEDPMFVRPPLSDGPQDPGDTRLRVGSPAIDLGALEFLPLDTWDLDADGDTTEVLPVDLQDEPRIQGDSVDAGAYEGGVTVAAQQGPAGDVSMAVWPNPTRASTTVELTLAAAGRVSVTLHDVLGREVAHLHDGLLGAGRHHLELDVRALRPGLYIVTARGASISVSRRLTVLS